MLRICLLRWEGLMLPISGTAGSVQVKWQIPALLLKYDLPEFGVCSYQGRSIMVLKPFLLRLCTARLGMCARAELHKFVQLCGFIHFSPNLLTLQQGAVISPSPFLCSSSWALSLHCDPCSENFFMCEFERVFCLFTVKRENVTLH